jgi:hypothetical protein
MNLRKGTTIGPIVAKEELSDLEWLIHAGTEDCRRIAQRASRADLIHAVRHCSMNPEGNKTRRAILETALRKRVASDDLAKLAGTAGKQERGAA